MLESEKKLVDTLVGAIEGQQKLWYHDEQGNIASLDYHALGVLAYTLVLKVQEEKENGSR